MPTLYGRHLIGNTVFLSLKDVAADLPLYSEHLTPVAMCPELAVPYHDMEAKLKEAVKQLLRRGSHQLLSPMLHALLAYTDYPYDWKLVGYVDAKDGSNGRFVLVTTPPTLNKNTLWPKGTRTTEDPRRGESPRSAIVGVLCLHEYTSGPGAARNDHQAGRLSSQGPRRQQGSHPQP